MTKSDVGQKESGTVNFKPVTPTLPSNSNLSTFVSPANISAQLNNLSHSIHSLNSLVVIVKIRNHGKH